MLKLQSRAVSTRGVGGRRGEDPQRSLRDCHSRLPPPKAAHSAAGSRSVAAGLGSPEGGGVAQAAARPWPAVAAAAAAASVASAPPAAPGSGARHFRAPPPRALYQSAAEKRRAPTVRRAHPTPWKEERGGGKERRRLVPLQQRSPGTIRLTAPRLSASSAPHPLSAAAA